MAWTKPKYTRQDVNKAANYIIRHGGVFDEKHLSHAIEVVDNFRSAHSFPLRTIQYTLRRYALNLDSHCIIAQRLKRFLSICMKLERFKDMQLWDMQDIGGCRAIVRNLDYIEKLVSTFKSGRIRHILAHEDDYVQHPRDSGYRSRHLIYRYISDRNEIYNRLKVEIQIRTPLQHAWATTVETVDTFTKQALKSSRGRSDWIRFFQLMGTEMAFREGTAPVTNTPTNRAELREELRNCAKELHVISSLRGFTTALRVTEYPSAKQISDGYFLLSLDNIKDRLHITGYQRVQLPRAAKAYADKEKQIRENRVTDAVLVSVDSISNLRRAYPNYYADTSLFAHMLRESIR